MQQFDNRWENLPPAFAAVYRCKAHPERDATPPIALRLCPECHETAKRDYAYMIEREPQHIAELIRGEWHDVDRNAPKRPKVRET